MVCYSICAIFWNTNTHLWPPALWDEAGPPSSWILWRVWPLVPNELENKHGRNKINCSPFYGRLCNLTSPYFLCPLPPRPLWHTALTLSLDKESFQRFTSRFETAEAGENNQMTGHRAGKSIFSNDLRILFGTKDRFMASWCLHSIDVYFETLQVFTCLFLLLARKATGWQNMRAAGRKCT